ncbi:hypothetical protein SSYRP_v1c07680 [Spiroplasma syrphidicola EA-1]|uniref:ATP-binding protein n=1 Tax=Spiroplasma syrphidicola EA-1 TaxID=1276229 RepID=R4U6V3_9MOLU|nr:ATP-binding protein [Spiroplasma syrphidicola]AGM26358.1 hypothetical protein SSYRP_v1c07680 [Spiroplasma syrphidicola EA-1]
MKSYTFDYVDNKIVQEFGKNLYKNTYSMITELVANSYDADAKNVLIWFKTINNKVEEICFFDDGNGMDTNDIQNKFLKIGYSKRTFFRESLVFKRPPMGRKGFGKLAVFGIGNHIELYSKTKKTSLETLLLSKRDIDNKINPHEIDKIDSDKVNYYNQFLNKFSSQNGTLISIKDFNKNNALNDVKNKINYRIYKAFKPLYSEKIENNSKMNIYVLKNEYFNIEKIELINPVKYIVTSFLKVYDLNYFSEKEIEKIQKTILSHKNPDISKKINVHENSSNRILSVVSSAEEAKELHNWLEKKLCRSYNDENYKINPVLFKELVTLKGFIGILDRIDRENNIGGIISIYSRNRVMISNIFDSIENTQIGSNYIIGDIFANYLDTDDENDIATPGRDAVDENDERFIYLKFFIIYLINKLITNRNEIVKKINDANQEKITKKYSNFTKKYLEFEEKVLKNSPQLDKEAEVLAKYISNFKNEKLPQKLDTVFISFKNYSSSKALNIENLKQSNSLTSFTSCFISEVLSEVLNKIKVINPKISIIYTKEDPKINYGTDITRYIKEKALNRKIENCCYFICASINYVDNWFTDIEYGGIYALNDELSNSEFVIFDSDKSKHSLSQSEYIVSPLATKTSYFDFSSIFLKTDSLILIEENKLFKFISCILDILKSNIEIEINNEQIMDINIHVKNFLLNNNEKVNIFYEAVQLIDLNKYKKYFKF